jgi:hypothetical protein
MVDGARECNRRGGTLRGDTADPIAPGLSDLELPARAKGRVEDLMLVKLVDDIVKTQTTTCGEVDMILGSVDYAKLHVAMHDVSKKSSPENRL